MKGGIKMKKKKKVPEFDPEDYEDEEEEEEEEPIEPETPKKKPEKKVTINDVLLNHEQRLQALESWAFRIKSQ